MSEGHYDYIQLPLYHFYYSKEFIIFNSMEQTPVLPIHYATVLMYRLSSIVIYLFIP